MATKRHATPKEITEILALREAGYTVLAISQKLQLSIRTIHRHIAAYGAKKGSIKAEVISKAREELLQLVTSSTSIREQVAKQVTDDLAHSQHIRSIMVDASEFLIATTPQEAAIVMRAAAAYSTALKNTSDTIRHSLGIDKSESDLGELPELIVKELSEGEIKEMISDQMVEEE